MTALASAAVFSWPVLVLMVAWSHRPPTRQPGARPTVVARTADTIGPLPVAVRVGRPVRRALSLPPDRAADRSAGRGLLGGAVVAAMLGPSAGVVVAVVGLALPIWRHRRHRLEHRAAVVRELPEVIDLLHLALAATGSVRLAVAAVAEQPTGPVGWGLAGVATAVDGGDRLGDALDGLGAQLDPAARPLTRALAGAERYGAELGPTLERLADEARALRRRGAEVAARRVPVRLLLPLVFCILPAFVVLTLVPVLSDTWASFSI